MRCEKGRGDSSVTSVIAAAVAVVHIADDFHGGSTYRVRRTFVLSLPSWWHRSGALSDCLSVVGRHDMPPCLAWLHVSTESRHFNVDSKPNPGRSIASFLSCWLGWVTSVHSVRPSHQGQEDRVLVPDHRHDRGRVHPSPWCRRPLTWSFLLIGPLRSDLMM
jgi:hypothetical protein